MQLHALKIQLEVTWSYCMERSEICGQIQYGGKVILPVTMCETFALMSVSRWRHSLLGWFSGLLPKAMHRLLGRSLSHRSFWRISQETRFGWCDSRCTTSTILVQQRQTCQSMRHGFWIELAMFFASDCSESSSDLKYAWIECLKKDRVLFSSRLSWIFVGIGSWERHWVYGVSDCDQSWIIVSRFVSWRDLLLFLGTMQGSKALAFVGHMVR